MKMIIKVAEEVMKTLLTKMPEIVMTMLEAKLDWMAMETVMLKLAARKDRMTMEKLMLRLIIRITTQIVMRGLTLPKTKNQKYL